MIHSRDFSASASARWLSCPASVVQVRQYKNTSSSAAVEGTAAHNLGEIALKENLTSEQLKGYLGKSVPDAPKFIINNEMVNYVEEYAEYCRSFKGDHFVEVKVSYENVVDGGFGTSDFISIDAENKTVYAVDLKYGKGLVVDAENNTQAQLYALGILNDFGFIYEFDETWSIEVHIYQPRVNNFSKWEISYNDLMSFADFVKKQTAISLGENPPYNPTEKGCQWCLHKANCTALMKFTEQTISAHFDDLELPAPETVNHKKVLENKKLIESWLKAVELKVFETLKTGGKVDGYKLVEGRSLRRWRDESKAFSELSKKYDADALETRKFLSVAQAEKLIGKKDFSNFTNLIIKPDGAPTLAPVDDKRPDINDVSCEFEEIDK